TMDNGVEFLDMAGVERSAISPDARRTVAYYCHPYCSFERGSNENLNKMIRRHIPKGADIAEYSEEDVARIQDWMNDYPRAIFGGLSAREMLQKEQA
ncbi:IS30 family transposase, partial [Clostridium sp. AF02-29]